MSHVATVAVEIRDLDALRVACAAAGLEFCEGQQTYKWFGTFHSDYTAREDLYGAGVDPKDFGKCDHAIRVPSSNPTRSDYTYEIGLVRRPDGSLKLQWDFWNAGYGLEAVAGAGCMNLVRAYVGEVARKTMLLQGYAPSGKRTLADGTVELSFSK